MSEDTYARALQSSLTEIKNICSDINHSFLFTKDGTLVAKDSEAENETVENSVNNFRSLCEQAEVMGQLEALTINGENGKIQFCLVEDIYLAMATSQKADLTHIRSLTQVVFSTVLKLLKTIAPTPINFIPSKQLAVETLSGFFVGDSVQVDPETLARWSQHLNQKLINEVQIEASDGKTENCKVKEIEDPDLNGKNIIRISEKVCKRLEIEQGAMVKVKPLPIGE